jgi:hypothetical protein
VRFDATPAHVQVGPGWTVTTLVDLTGVVPYNPNDFQDGTSETLDNSPISIAALYPPFTETIAVGAGRSLIVVDAAGHATVYDYRPAAPDTTGPDELAHLVFGAPADTGPALWVGASSQGNGDGVYYISPVGWQITRDAANNNVNGIAWDATGAFEAVGTPSIYFIDMSAVNRRTGAGASVSIYPQPNSMGYLAMTATALFVENGPNSGPLDLDRILATSHTLQVLATSFDFRVAEGAPTDATTVITIRDTTALASYAFDGTSQDLAWSIDPDWSFVAASAPQPPHPLAGSYLVLEWNVTLEQTDILEVSPAS